MAMAATFATGYVWRTAAAASRRHLSSEKNRKIFNVGGRSEWEDIHLPMLRTIGSRHGVPRDPNTQLFDEYAPLAAIRIALTTPRKS